MDARTARGYKKEDWVKLASDIEDKIEGRLFINGEYVDAEDGTPKSNNATSEKAVLYN